MSNTIYGIYEELYENLKQSPTHKDVNEELDSLKGITHNMKPSQIRLLNKIATDAEKASYVKSICSKGDRIIVNSNNVEDPIYNLGTILSVNDDGKIIYKLDNGYISNSFLTTTALGIIGFSSVRLRKVSPISTESLYLFLDRDRWITTALSNPVVRNHEDVVTNNTKSVYDKYNVPMYNVNDMTESIRPILLAIATITNSGLFTNPDMIKTNTGLTITIQGFYFVIESSSMLSSKLPKIIHVKDLDLLFDYIKEVK